jgi:NitT/TauT family transport system ATP-binding protein
VAHPEAVPDSDGALAMKNDQHAIICEDVGKVWLPGTPRAHEALRGCNLEVKPNEFVVLLGPSGCGKSTLLYLFAGLESATSGKILSFGEPVAQPSPDRALIFQETSLFPWLTVLHNVAFGLSLRGMSKGEQTTIARAALERVGLAEAENKRPVELSGGMRQRVAVARALAMRPNVLLMDEPFAALDVQTRAKMQGFLLDVWRESNASIIFVTHQIDEAIALADKVAVFTARPGRIKTVVPIDIPRPRDPFSPSCEELRLHLTRLLADEVDAAFAEQELLKPGSRS